MAAVAVHRSSKQRRILSLLFLFVVVAGFYAATFDFRGLTDTRLNSLQTQAFVRHGDLDLARYGADTRGYTVRDGANVYSIYGVGISLIAAPFYAVLTHAGASDSFLQGSVSIALVAAAVLFMFRFLLSLVPPHIAAGGTLAFGFGTTLWPLATMALFQHGAVALLHVLGLTGLFSKRSWAPFLAGLAFGTATLVRSTSAIPLVIIGILYATEGLDHTRKYVLGTALPLAGILIQNRWIWGSWLSGGYFEVDTGLNGDMPAALVQLLFGWWRGLLVYSPILALAAIGWVSSIRRPRGFNERRLAFLGASCLFTILLYSRKAEWWGGLHQFGYRYLLDVVPFLIVLATWAWAKRERLRMVAMSLCGLSILTMTFGTARNRFAWDGVMFPKRLADAPIGQAWIVFIDKPWGSVARLIGIATIGTVLITFGKRLASDANQPAA